MQVQQVLACTARQHAGILPLEKQQDGRKALAVDIIYLLCIFIPTPSPQMMLQCYNPYGH